MLLCAATLKVMPSFAVEIHKLQRCGETVAGVEVILNLVISSNPQYNSLNHMAECKDTNNHK